MGRRHTSLRHVREGIAPPERASLGAPAPCTDGEDPSVLPFVQYSNSRQAVLADQNQVLLLPYQILTPLSQRWHPLSCLVARDV